MIFPGHYPEDGLARWWRHPAGQGRQESNDQRLARLVLERLHNDPWTCLRNVKVQVQNRVVILEGRLDSARARWVAVDHAWQTPGVFDVCDMLTGPGRDDDDLLH